MPNAELISLHELSALTGIKYPRLLEMVGRGEMPKAIYKIKGPIIEWYVPDTYVTKLNGKKPRQNKIEADVEKACVDYAKDNGCLSVKLQGSGNKGWPDRFFIGPYGLCFVEFKKPKGGILSPHQRETIWKLKQFKDVFVVSTFEYFRANVMPCLIGP